MNIEEGTSVTVYCPYCDRGYDARTRKGAENKAKIHVRGQHPEMENPFESAEN